MSLPGATLISKLSHTHTHAHTHTHTHTRTISPSGFSFVSESHNNLYNANKIKIRAPGIDRRVEPSAVFFKFGGTLWPLLIIIHIFVCTFFNVCMYRQSPVKTPDIKTL